MYRTYFGERRTATVYYWMPGVGLTSVSRPVSIKQSKKKCWQHVITELLRAAVGVMKTRDASSEPSDQLGISCTTFHYIHTLPNHQRTFLDSDYGKALEDYKFALQPHAGDGSGILEHFSRLVALRDYRTAYESRLACTRSLILASVAASAGNVASPAVENMQIKR